LSNEQLAQLEDVQRHMSVLHDQIVALDDLRGHLKERLDRRPATDANNRTWTQWLRSDTVQKAIAATEVAVAMAFKFGAWYGVETILPGKSDAFATTAKTAALIAQRVVLSLALAGIGEYIPGTDGPKRWVNAGGDLKTIQGFGQAVDQAITLAGQYGTNAASGQAAPALGHIVGFGLVGLGGVLQTGALNKTITGAMAYLRRGQAEPEAGLDLVDVDDLRSRQQTQANARERTSQDAQVSPDLERGLGEGAQGEVQDMLQTLHAQHLPRMQGHATRAFESVANAYSVLASEAGGARGAEEAAAFGQLQAAAVQSLSQPAPLQDDRAQIEKFRENLDSIRSAAEALRDELEPDDELRAQIDQVFTDAKAMEEAVAAASTNLSTHETAFLHAMTGLGAVGLLLTFIGPPTGNKWLSNLNNRAAIAGLTSSIGQNLANLGQFLGGAKPGDGRLKRFLKIGLDNENDNQVMKFAKDWGRNTRFLPIEFVPLTISTTLAEMGSKLKGQIPEAPSNATPSVTTDRLMMEALRMALSNAFMVFRLGHRLEWNHYAGMAATLAGAATAVGTELRK
jgi:hypothetical protein